MYADACRHVIVVVTMVVGLMSPPVVARDLNARYRKQSREIGSLCSGWNQKKCKAEIPHIHVHNVPECAAKCAENPKCQSFNFKLAARGPAKVHRCEMAPQKSYPISNKAKNSHGFQYFQNLYGT